MRDDSAGAGPRRGRRAPAGRARRRDTWTNGVEAGGKALLLRAAAALAGGGRRAALPDWDARPHRVLYVRHDGIGDMIMATGTLRAIAAAHPTLALDVLTHPGNAEALCGLPFLHAVIPFRPGRRWAYPPRVLARIRRRRYDVVIDGMMRRFVDGRVQRPRVKSSTVLLMLASRAPYRIGMAGRPNDFIYTIPVHPPAEETVHHVEYAAALAGPLGVRPAEVDLRPELRLAAEERTDAERRWRALGVSRRLVVNVSAANARRRWPEEHYVELLRHVAARQADVMPLVIGAPGERDLITRIGARAGAPVHTPGLREAFALAATADAVVTPETSIGHAAGALGTPVVVLAPRGHEHLVPYEAAGRTLFGEDGTIASIPAQAAARALDDTLAARGAPRGRRGDR